MPRLPNTLSHPVRATLAALKALAAAHLFARYGWATAHGEGPSMLPTFPVSGDQQFVVSRAHRRGRGVAVGDCVVYAIPARAAGEEGVKRVIGMPGDYVLLNSPGALGPAAPDGSAAAKAGPGAGAGAGEGGKRGRECASMMQVSLLSFFRFFLLFLLRSRDVVPRLKLKPPFFPPPDILHHQGQTYLANLQSLESPFPRSPKVTAI